MEIEDKAQIPLCTFLNNNRTNRGQTTHHKRVPSLQPCHSAAIPPAPTGEKEQSQKNSTDHKSHNRQPNQQHNKRKTLAISLLCGFATNNLPIDNQSEYNMQPQSGQVSSSKTDMRLQ